MKTKNEKKQIKNCKKCLNKRFSNLTICYSHYQERSREKRLEKLQRKSERKARLKEKKANSPKVLKKKLDAVFSEYIRRRSVIEGSWGKIRCACCGVLIPWKKAQNMHYVGRAHMNTRWDERNCNAGCLRCNVMLNGNYPAYTKYLLDSYGAEWLDRLILDGRKIRQWTPDELKELINKYQELIKTL